MEISIADQIALDDALEETLQVVYDVLKLTPFYKAFQVTADAPEIYMQEFWASAYVHNRSVRFKMNNKKHILGLDQFRDILQICPKVGNKKFEEPPLEKEILAFLASLGHSGEIRKITDVNVNKLHQPWRSFAAIINKCLSGKPSYDSLRLSQAQILWGMYNKKNVDYAYLLWEDFIYQIENKNTKKGNAMYYPRFTKLVVNFVMDKDPSIPRRNKVNWHYARDDPMFTTINVISRNEDTQYLMDKDHSALMISPWSHVEDDQADDKNDNDDNAQDDEDDDKNDDDENAQDDDDEAKTESEDDGDDLFIQSSQLHDDERTHEEVTDEDVTFDPIIHYTPIMLILSLMKDSDIEVDGVEVKEEKSDEDATYLYVKLPPGSSNPGRLKTLCDSNSEDKFSEAVDVAVQLKYDRIREEAQAENQQFLDSIDEGMKNEAKTSHAVAATLSELELKNIFIDKMEANNSINKLDIQRQLYKALVDAYEADKILLDTYGDTVHKKGLRRSSCMIKKPSAEQIGGPKEEGSKTHKQSASQSAPVEETMQSTDVFDAPAHQEFETGVHDEQAEEEVHHLPDWFQQPKRLPSPDHAWNKSVPAVHESVQPWLSNLARRQDPRESFDELTDTTFDFSAFVMNRLNVKTLTPELSVSKVYKATTEKLDWINPEGRQYPHDLDDDILYKFKEGDFHRLRIQDIEDISVVIQRRVEDLQLGVESYQKKLTLIRPDTYRSNLRRRDTYTPYSDPRGFIYENKDKKNRLMRIDELHKFSDDTLDDVRNALTMIASGYRMEYMPRTFWSLRDKDLQELMIQANWRKY
ncbi:hypothetical protein Tco_0958258 [Tanacetum coccineum]